MTIDSLAAERPFDENRALIYLYLIKVCQAQLPDTSSIVLAS